MTHPTTSAVEALRACADNLERYLNGIGLEHDHPGEVALDNARQVIAAMDLLASADDDEFRASSRRALPSVSALEQESHASDCAVHNAPALEPGPCDGREWFWHIVDANGLADLPSIEEDALRLLIHRATLNAAPPAGGVGWKLVPREPTQDMRDAVAQNSWLGEALWTRGWQSMWDAAAVHAELTQES